MSYSFELWSHPEKLLKDHISNVFKNGQNIYERIQCEEEFKKLLDICLLLHDAGKASSYFQKYIKSIDKKKKGLISEEEFAEIKYKLGNHKNHARISAVWAFIIAEQLFQNPSYPLIGFLTVLKHHGNFFNLEKMLEFSSIDNQLIKDISAELNYTEFAKILEVNGYSFLDFNHSTLVNKIDSFFSTRNYRRKWKNEIKDVLSPSIFYKTSLAFSILLSADKGECIFNGLIYNRKTQKLPSNLVDTFKEQTFKSLPTDTLNQLRNDVYNSVDEKVKIWNRKDRFLSINVPTGIGKTLTVINAALKLQDKKPDLEKIIYCLPFTSVIDQNSEVIKEILALNDIENNSENLMVNHHLTELKYKASDDEVDENESEFLITQFESNLNVTTFYQLLHGIFTGKNNEIKKLHSFSNSIIILDEVQSIPSKYWPLIKEAFSRIAEELNIIFIFVTATLPMIFSEEKGEIKELVKNKQEIFKSLNRIQLDTSLLKQSIQEEDFLEILKQDITTNSEKSFLIILNTIKASKNIFHSLRHEYSNLIYLSTNIPPIERLRRIQKIKKAKIPYIVVSTQLVEAGVDIDLDVVYRDLAPLDSIFQSAGRCNRNAGQTKGIVKVFSLLDNRKRYASYIYSHSDLDTTRELLKEKELFYESDFFDLGNTYYKKVSMSSNMDDSDHILNEMSSLNYTNAFDPKRHEQAFQLIKQLPTFPAYIAFEDKAKKLLDEYFEIRETEFDSPFEKKRQIKSVLKKLSKYSVSVPEKYAFKDKTFYYVISDEHQDFAYDQQTGIEFEDDLGIFC